MLLMQRLNSSNETPTHLVSALQPWLTMDYTLDDGDTEREQF